MDNDHITHRVLHVQFVSKIARTIGRALKLNEDLIEAISLGHDIGHVPFGHIGEEVLSELCKKNNIGCFAHNAQSVQFLDVIEDRNLTLQVLDGILCHNGEQPKQKLVPNGRVPDEGACVEVGYACAIGKECIGLKTDTRALMSNLDNPLIVGVLNNRIARNFDDLGKFLIQIKKNVIGRSSQDAPSSLECPSAE